MKKFFSFAMAAAVTFGLASCSKDNTMETGGDDALAAVSFTFEKPQGSYNQTRADIASAEEWNIAELEVYAAVDGTVAKLIKDTDYTQVDGTRQYTVTMKPEWVNPNVGKAAKFYFVGNDATSTNGRHTQIAAGSEATFVNANTNTLGASEVITAGSGKNLLFSEVVTVASIQGKVQATGELKRRMARFDVENTIGTALNVQSIKVSHARMNGLVFKTGAENNQAWGSHNYDFTGTPLTYDATSKLAESVFYLYPTEMGDGTGSTTQIVIEAKVNGNDQTFVVNSTEKIIANKRYILSFSQTTLQFTLKVMDWDTETVLPVEPGTDNAAIVPGNFVASVPGNWNAAGLVYTFDATPGATLKFDVTTQFGTQHDIVYVAGGTPTTNIAVNSVPTITYAGYSTKDAYTITVPADANDGFAIRVDITAKQGTGKTSILFQKGTVAAEDLVGGNTGLGAAIENALNKQPGTPISLEDLNSVTTINVSGSSGASSLDGIENLPNLTEINAKDNSNLTEIDLSGNPALTDLNLRNTSIEEIDLSNNPNLEKIDLCDTKISGTVDFSNNTKLKEIAINRVDITSIDISHLTDLEYLTVNGTKISSIDISNNLKLHTLGVADSELDELDLSNHNLKILNIGNSKIDNLILGDLSNMVEFSADNSVLNSTEISFASSSNLRFVGITGSNITKINVTGAKQDKTLGIDAVNMAHPITIVVWADFVEANMGNIFRYFYRGSTVYSFVNE